MEFRPSRNQERVMKNPLGEAAYTELYEKFNGYIFLSIEEAINLCDTFNSEVIRIKNTYGLDYCGDIFLKMIEKIKLYSNYDRVLINCLNGCVKPEYKPSNK